MSSLPNQELEISLLKKVSALLLEETLQGNCLIPFNTLFSKLQNELKVELNKTFLENLLFKSQLSIFKKTERNFGSLIPETLVSFQVSTLSLEIIICILKSAKNDSMEASEELVHSRLKEFFGLDLCMKDWKEFLRKLYQK